MENKSSDNQLNNSVINDLENILNIMVLLNESIKPGLDQEKLEHLVNQHQEIVVRLQESESLFINPFEINSETIKEASELITKIINEEKITRNLIEVELGRTKSELKRIQSMKNAGNKYHKSLQQEARFIDKTK